MLSSKLQVSSYAERKISLERALHSCLLSLELCIGIWELCVGMAILMGTCIGSLGTLRLIFILYHLLDSLKVRRPWRRNHSTPSVPSKKPNELSMCLVNGCNCYSLFVVDSNIGQFVQGHGRGCALDSFPNLFLPKQVVIPDELKVEKFPHYMGKTNSYHSTSVLGLIYDTVEKSSQSEDLPAKGESYVNSPCT
ncbi:hypothetical protein RHMOL_Rhmol10G0185600 [Rhododendron molle]|uniref:Uncharacterized protein n=1 Tax=Rhododendron molle TaxID=49168 RepID=A0ACC0M4S3_RHOML|nr:hypothetical protein RHMOL_Rhmol10G0185600 [Rhododendron molle]